MKRNSILFSNKHPMHFSQGIEDYFPNANIPLNEVLHVIHDSFDEFDVVMGQLLENILEEIDMHSLYHLVEHTGYHLGQLVDRSKRLTNKQFDFCQNV